jgi:acetoacetyl-CoA synthetase
VNQGTKTDTIERLGILWRRILKTQNIGIDDNFFELAGDPQHAVQLFREIEDFCPRGLPALLIYQAPTIRSLAAILDAHDEPRLSSIIELKGGTKEPPVFLLHGMGGNVFEFFEFVRHVQTCRSIYGIQARGTDGFDEPCKTVDEMARFNLSEIRKLQPHGPYFMIGYSLGGLVALEMARYLTESGESIALLAMVDSYPVLRYVPLAQLFGVYARKIRRRLESLSRQSSNANRVDQASDKLNLTPAMRLVRDCAARGLRDYVPRYYAGTVQFVRAQVSLHFPRNATAVWSKLVHRFEVETVSGDHQEILTKYSDQLATILSRYLREADERGSTKGTRR